MGGPTTVVGEETRRENATSEVQYGEDNDLLARETPLSPQAGASAGSGPTNPAEEALGKRGTDRRQPAPARPSYHPTRWPAINRLLDVVDVLTRGRADWIQRLATYLVFGGTAAVVNLGVFAALLAVALPVSEVAHNLIAYLVAAEASIMVNYLLNDYVTFRYLPGHSRGWLARCARFHVTCIAGTILAYVIQLALHFAAGLPSLLAEALAIAILTAFNFTVHHVFTYRRLKSPAAPAPR